jgi:hypothetical protein
MGKEPKTRSSFTSVKRILLTAVLAVVIAPTVQAGLIGATLGTCISAYGSPTSVGVDKTTECPTVTFFSREDKVVITVTLRDDHVVEANFFFDHIPNSHELSKSLHTATNPQQVQWEDLGSMEVGQANGRSWKGFENSTYRFYTTLICGKLSQTAEIDVSTPEFLSLSNAAKGK